MSGATIMTISHLVLWVIVILQAVFMLALFRLVGQLMKRRFPGAGARVIDPGPDVGSDVEGWTVQDLADKQIRIQFPRQRDIFLLYMSPHCSVCAGLLPSAKRFAKEISAQCDPIWVISLGSPEAKAAYAWQSGLAGHAVVNEDHLPEAWQIGGAPFGLWISAAGRVLAKGMVNNREHLESLRNAAELGYASLQSYAAAQTERAEQQREQASTI